MADDERDFRDYAAARMPALRRSAYLLCGNVHQADDLVSIAVGKLYRSWRKVSRLDQPDAYLRRILVNVWMDERRRPWRREWSTDTLPEPPPRHDHDVDDAVMLRDLLARLPARRRAVLVLRFLDDLSVEDTAAALGCAAGTVKAQTAQGLADLRTLLGVPHQSAAPARKGELA